MSGNPELALTVIHALERKVSELKLSEWNWEQAARTRMDVIRHLCDTLHTVRDRVDRLMAWDNNILDSETACVEYKADVAACLMIPGEIDEAIKRAGA